MCRSVKGTINEKNTSRICGVNDVIDFMSGEVKDLSIAKRAFTSGGLFTSVEFEILWSP